MPGEFWGGKGVARGGGGGHGHILTSSFAIIYLTKSADRMIQLMTTHTMATHKSSYTNGYNGIDYGTAAKGFDSHDIDLSIF